ncbi:hypothetical protein BDV26DRAFT_254887 [Aspergillus bertholletiae]|uniref:SnoaL-like domain-containing protein n=1 Tax=Aspergillus bertholletiae TaxID=1226010 RepID=A0A5N7BIV3_9EURO|nr:hypothetical protein BDV26DRAFT_254887 [Aspergillus bertholletiae]
MTISTTIIRGSPSHRDNKALIATSPVLSWYARYVVDFATAKTTTPPTKYYASTATLVNPDQSTISGADAIWDYYIHLYGQFEKCAHEVISMTALSNDETGTHTLLVETINHLHLRDNKGVVPLPQAFAYEISEAEEGAGTAGLQIWELRCYFERGLLQRVAKS